MISNSVKELEAIHVKSDNICNNDIESFFLILQ